VAARAENCADLERELRLFVDGPGRRGWVPLPFQTFNAQDFGGTPPGTAEKDYLYHPSRSVDLVFLASAPAGASKVYLLAYDNPDAGPYEPQPTDLKVSGPALGALVENRFYEADLDDRSGQIASFRLKRGDEYASPSLTNAYSAAAHWNPDSFSDNGRWGHTFAWDPPERTVVSAQGPILFRITNSGRMPEYTPQVHASVSYSFYASVPYVKVRTVMEVRDPLNASALRNGEIVLDSHLITHFVWQEKSGDVHTIRTAHGPNWQDEWGARVDHDVPWIAMTNELDNFGLGAIVLASLAFDPVHGEAAAHRTAYYLYYHNNWAIPLTYFTRAWLYPFSDYQRGPIIPVKAGSTYLEEEAFMPFLLYDRGHRYRAIQDAQRRLANPLVARWGR